MKNKSFMIIEKLGGRDEAFAAMAGSGYRGEMAALRMMISRGRLSAEAMRALMMAADKAGISYDASDFVVSGASAGAGSWCDPAAAAGGMA